MNKKMRELQAQILSLTAEAKAFMEGETKDLAKAEETLNKIDELQKEFDIEERLYKATKTEAKDAAPVADEKVDGFKLMGKIIARKSLDEREKTALITGEDAASGENYLVPEDVKLKINELRKSYISARDVVTVETTTALTGSVNYESGTPSGLTAFDDGDAITEESNLSFAAKTFNIGWFGKLIPISRILLGAERSGLLSYLNRWFVKNAVLSENSSIFSKLKSGYNSGTAKSVAGWAALKASILEDLDPSCLIDGVIVTNQKGFSCLDNERDENGRPILESNPAKPTERLFQGLPIRVYPTAQLDNIDSTHFPMIYGSLKAGCTFVEYENLQFATSEHYGFNKNQNYLRVIEGFDVMSTDTSAYIYGSFSATPTT